MAKKNFFLRTFENIEWRIAIKTGIAAGLSLFFGLAFSQLMQRPDSLVSGMWCVMSAIVVTQAHLGGTYKASWIRFLGVFIGSVMGALFTVYFGADPLSLGFSICGTILLCSLFGIKESVRIASLSVAVVLILWGLRPTISPWTFALYRFLDSTLGILIAVFVAHAFWPEKAINNLQRNCSLSLLAMSKLYRLATDVEDESEKNDLAAEELITEIDQILEENHDFNEVSKLELLTTLDSTEGFTVLVDQLDTIFKTLVTMKQIPKSILAKVFDDALGNQVTEIIDKTDLAFQQLAKAIEDPDMVINLEELRLSLDRLHEEQMRFRTTRTTRKFNLEDVESFFMFFYGLRSIAEELIKMRETVLRLFK